MSTKPMLLFFLTVLFLGCSSDVEKYIRSNEKDLSTLEMISEVELDSIYSPYRDLQSVQLAQSFYYVELMELYSAYTNENSDSLRSKLNESIIRYDSVGLILDSIMVRSQVSYNMPENIKGDYKAVKAKYRADGHLEEKYFYYDKEGKEILNTSDDVKRLLNDVNRESSELFIQNLEIKRDIKK